MDAISYIHSVSWMGSKLGLTRIRELMRRMGNPQNQLKFVHVAGTNGKGSTSCIISSILRAAGYRAGLFTSPYIERFHERIQVNGVPITDEALGQITDFVRAHAEAMDDHPTEFELITAIGFEYFHRMQCDIVVLEVGLGGRMDSTNVINAPECAVITAIGLDHMRELGLTITRIAHEKAGIVKPGTDVILYDQRGEAADVVEAVCAERGARLVPSRFHKVKPLSRNLTGQVFEYGRFKDLSFSLLGAHQLKNAATALSAVEVLIQKGWRIDECAVKRGLAEVHWPGRFEPVSRSPDFIVDGGHNPQGAQALVECIRDYLPGRHITLLLGVLKDKDYETMLDIAAPLASAFVTVAPVNARALSADGLARALMRFKRRITACPTIELGVRSALKLTPPGGAVVAFGSLYIVGAIRACFKSAPEAHIV